LTIENCPLDSAISLHGNPCILNLAPVTSSLSSADPCDLMNLTGIPLMKPCLVWPCLETDVFPPQPQWQVPNGMGQSGFRQIHRPDGRVNLRGVIRPPETFGVSRSDQLRHPQLYFPFSSMVSTALPASPSPAQCFSIHILSHPIIENPQWK